MNRVNIVTLGVLDLKRSKKFFNDLFGWMPIENSNEHIAFFDMGGWLVALYSWDSLAEDALTSPSGEGFRGVTIAHNVPDKTLVAGVLSKAKSLGAELVKPAQDVFWGGHSGYFKDLDGHLWEVAWNPFMPVLPDGRLQVGAK